jgi:hypothetical protein
MSDFSIQDWKAAIVVVGIIAGYIVALSAWMVRLEAKILSIEKDQKRKDTSDEKIWAKIDSLQNNMTGVLQSLSRIEGKLDVPQQKH